FSFCAEKKPQLPTLPKSGEGWGTHVSVLEVNRDSNTTSVFQIVHESGLRFKGLDTWPPRRLFRGVGRRIGCVDPAEMLSLLLFHAISNNIRLSSKYIFNVMSELWDKIANR